MAGGVKKPVNIFKLKDLGEPKEVFNWKIWFAVISFGLLGAARGVDEGLISGAFNSKDFQATINYDSYDKFEQANIKANVSAMVQIGSVAGALMYVLPMGEHTMPLLPMRVRDTIKISEEVLVFLLTPMRDSLVPS